MYKSTKSKMFIIALSCLTCSHIAICIALDLILGCALFHKICVCLTIPTDAVDTLDERVKAFFANAKRVSTEQQDEECRRICEDYQRVILDAEEKVQIANQIYDLVERYLRKLDQELQKFKIELEADNAGITEILEKRKY